MTPLTSNNQPPRILLVEDERKTRESVREGLGMEEWQVIAVASGTEAMKQIENAAFDLVILDWGLPGSNGLEVLKQTRIKEIMTPVLMLTARSTVGDRVLGLEAGADDYLVKPFAFEELVARSRALLRRATIATERTMRYDDLQLDVRARLAFRNGVEIVLTPREVDILDYLLHRPGQVVTREMLERDVWRQPQRFTSLDNVIDVQMMRLRKKIDGDSAPKLLHTLRGVGYRLGKDGA